VHACHLYYIVVYYIIILLRTSSSDQCVYIGRYTCTRGIWLSAGALKLRSCSLRRVYIRINAETGYRRLAWWSMEDRPDEADFGLGPRFFCPVPESEKSTHRGVRSGLGAQDGRWRRVCTHVIVFYAIRMWPSVYCLNISRGSSEGDFLRIHTL